VNSSVILDSFVNRNRADKKCFDVLDFLVNCDRCDKILCGWSRFPC